MHEQPKVTDLAVTPPSVNGERVASGMTAGERSNRGVEVDERMPSDYAEVEHPEDTYNTAAAAGAVAARDSDPSQSKDSEQPDDSNQSNQEHAEPDPEPAPQAGGGGNHNDEPPKPPARTGAGAGADDNEDASRRNLDREDLGAREEDIHDAAARVASHLGDITGYPGVPPKRKPKDTGPKGEPEDVGPQTLDDVIRLTEENLDNTTDSEAREGLQAYLDALKKTREDNEAAKDKVHDGLVQNGDIDEAVLREIRDRLRALRDAVNPPGNSDNEDGSETTQEISPPDPRVEEQLDEYRKLYGDKVDQSINGQPQPTTQPQPSAPGKDRYVQGWVNNAHFDNDNVNSSDGIINRPPADTQSPPSVSEGNINEGVPGYQERPDGISEYHDSKAPNKIRLRHGDTSVIAHLREGEDYNDPSKTVLEVNVRAVISETADTGTGSDLLRATADIALGKGAVRLGADVDTEAGFRMYHDAFVGDNQDLQGEMHMEYSVEGSDSVMNGFTASADYDGVFLRDAESDGSLRGNIRIEVDLTAPGVAEHIANHLPIHPVNPPIQGILNDKIGGDSGTSGGNGPTATNGGEDTEE